MKHNYLRNSSWREITREERYFCFELFDSIRSNPKPFLELIKKKELSEIEVAVEVCFYRDLLFDNGIAVKEHNKGQSEDEKLSQKRTFDLVIFAENEMIIFEAKVSEGFGGKQLENIKNKEYEKFTIKTFQEINIKNFPKISMIGIHSSKYNPKQDTKGAFDLLITWEKIASIYDSQMKFDIFSRADSLYGKPSK